MRTTLIIAAIGLTTANYFYAFIFGHDYAAYLAAFERSFFQAVALLAAYALLAARASTESESHE